MAETSKEQMSEMMVGRKVNFIVDKPEMTPGEPVLEVKNLTVNPDIMERLRLTMYLSR